MIAEENENNKVLHYSLPLLAAGKIFVMSLYTYFALGHDFEGQNPPWLLTKIPKFQVKWYRM